MQLVSDEPDIEPETAKKIFIDNVHEIPPHKLTESGFRLDYMYMSHSRYSVYM